MFPIDLEQIPVANSSRSIRTISFVIFSKLPPINVTQIIKVREKLNIG